VTVHLRGTPQGLQALLKKLGTVMPAATVRGMREVGLRLQGDFVQKQIQATEPIPVDMGQYKAGWMLTPTASGCIVGNATKQATPIEVGRKPGKMPPLEPLLYWAKRHGFKNWGGVAVAIQHKIFHYGIKGRLVLKNTLIRFTPQMSKTLRRSLEEQAAGLK
jgi:hypothetical protein